MPKIRERRPAGTLAPTVARTASRPQIGARVDVVVRELVAAGSEGRPLVVFAHGHPVARPRRPLDGLGVAAGQFSRPRDGHVEPAGLGADYRVIDRLDAPVD